MGVTKVMMFNYIAPYQLLNGSIMFNKEKYIIMIITGKS
jgi:hypothetical protein